MSDVPARPSDDPPTAHVHASGRVLDAQTSFGRRDDGQPAHGLTAASLPMRMLVRAVQRLAPVARTALITGAPGTGKSRVAAAVHRLGPCRGGAQLTLLGADDDDELECLRDAARGAREPITVFVPELRDLPAEHQAALVRALVASASLPPGEGLHVVAATALDPADATSRGLVRADLVNRLGALRFHLPALAERRDDIALLATTFLRETCRALALPDRTWALAALAALEARTWPGNVRELRHAVTRAAVLSDDLVIGAHVVREACGPDGEQTVPDAAAGLGGRDRLEGKRVAAGAERARILAALAAAGGNKSTAAAALGVSRRAFYRLLDKLGA